MAHRNMETRLPRRYRSRELRTEIDRIDGAMHGC